jgi:hypothetical protein
MGQRELGQAMGAARAQREAEEELSGGLTASSASSCAACSSPS